MTDFAPRYPVVPGDFTTVKFGATPSQTVGPYLHIGLPWADGANVVAPGTPGAVRVTVTVVDGNREPIADALVETWQADAEGRFDHPDDPRGSQDCTFRGFGRVPADASGTVAITTVKPGALPAENGLWEAPHIDVSVFARGMLDRAITRIYFPDEEEANAADPVLSSLPEAQRAKLVARATSTGYHFDIVVQDTDPNGAETPFFRF
ncbi:protocatechuate 3,4-dioxygenase subunit alpha [Rhodococcus gannanensis]|uniref:Protocatechuate 3,4-dioxygenase subunit alpha n=1 Tax=Rhodococcus gannanensis TaxID=1960308 RepID=A0ABW4NZW3_9NOCA